MVVYPGPYTKIMMNSKTTPFKQSSYEKVLNVIVVFELGLQTLLCLVASVFAGLYIADDQKEYMYYSTQNSPLVGGLLRYATFFILLNTLIPISLIITLELVKFLQKFGLEDDLEMYSEEQDQPMRVQNMSILEDLGRVDYIFADKTGTLTSNTMEFRGCIVGPKTYGNFEMQVNQEEESSAEYLVESPDYKRNIEYFSEGEIVRISYSQTPLGHMSCNTGKYTQDNPNLWNFDSQAIHEDLENSCDQLKLLEEFFNCLVVCNEVVAFRSNTGELKYLGASPDEVTLVDAAKMIGCVFLERRPSSVLASCFGSVKEFEVLATNEFSSDRKRMSVVVKHSEELKLYLKGADDTVLPRLRKTSYLQETKEAVSMFSKNGLRSLLVAYKDLDPQEFRNWLARYNQVKAGFSEKQELESLAEELERDLELIGATAVEDKLQLGVANVIKELTEANICVCMLTGDKMETAENIAYACNLLNPDWNIHKISSDCKKEIFSSLSSIYRELNNHPTGLIIEGNSLQKSLKYPKLYEVMSQCKSIVVSRATPKQKSEVVSFMKNKRSVTLAIGDGGNDISMIQTADVGVGVYGKEGHQAADSSDFAISQFRFLRPLLFQHGRWNANRIAFFILYFFFKNLIFTLPQFYFAFLSGFSGQTLWDDWYLLLYNSVVTAAGVVMYSIWDQDVNYKVNPEIKPYLPFLYKENKQRNILSIKNYLLWLAYGVYGSFVVFLVPAKAYEFKVLVESGFTDGLWAMSVAMYTCVVFIVNFILVIEIRSWTWIQHLVIWGLCFILYLPVFVFVYSVMPGVWDFKSTSEYLGTFTHWAAVVVSVWLGLLPYVSLSLYKRVFDPTLADKLISSTQNKELLSAFSTN